MVVAGPYDARFVKFFLRMRVEKNSCVTGTGAIARMQNRCITRPPAEPDDPSLFRDAVCRPFEPPGGACLPPHGARLAPLRAHLSPQAQWF